MFQARSIAVIRAKELVRSSSSRRRAGVSAACRVRPYFTVDSGRSSFVGRGALLQSAASDVVSHRVGRQHLHSESVGAQECGEGKRHTSGNSMLSAPAVSRSGRVVLRKARAQFGTAIDATPHHNSVRCRRLVIVKCVIS